MYFTFICAICSSQQYIRGTLHGQAAYLYICFIFAESNGLNTLSELHKFITGCERVLPLGLPKHITVKFKHDCMERCRCRPTASTCDLSVTLPVHYHDNYSEFKESIDSALVEGKGFGLL